MLSIPPAEAKRTDHGNYTRNLDPFPAVRLVNPHS